MGPQKEHAMSAIASAKMNPYDFALSNFDLAADALELEEDLVK